MRHEEKYGGRLYRSRDGMIFGVCKGIANATGLSVVGLRIALVLLFLLTAGFPVFLFYALAALIMKVEPREPQEPVGGDEYYQRQDSINRIKEKFDDLDKRASRLENYVTAREFDWEQRLG